MVRTVISLEEKAKRWLDRKAKERHVTMTALVRQALRSFIESEESQKPSKPSYEEILEMTKGSWTQGDGLVWQRKLRSEWDRPWDKA